MAKSKAFPMPTEHTRSIISGRPTPGRLLSRERRAQVASQIASYEVKGRKGGKDRIRGEGRRE